MALRTPSRLAIDRAITMRSSSPEMTIWPGELMLAMSTSVSAAISRTTFSSAPINAAIAPMLSAQASSMNWPRASTSLRPVGKSNVPAAVCAVNSPSDSPAAAATGKSPAFSRRAASVARPWTKSAGWQLPVRVSSSMGPS